MTPARIAIPAQQRGMGIVEVMVGILIGMIVVAAIYNVFAVAEGYKRTAVGAADAQTTGVYAQFVLRREIGNAGTAISGAGGELATCTAADPGWPVPVGFGGPYIRPIPVLIRDGGAPNVSDSFLVTYSTAPRVITPMLFIDKPMTIGTDKFYIQSPNGFNVNDRVIAINMLGFCELTRATAVVKGDSLGNVTTGVVGISHPGTAHLYLPGSANDGARLLNMGQVGTATRTLYDVFNGQLRTTDVFGAAPANPIAQNVVLMKAQYGVDCGNNGVISWTTATATNICGDALNYTPNDFVPAVWVPGCAVCWTGPNLARIRAIRVGVVVRSDEPDLKDASLKFVNRPLPQMALFDCSTHNALCPGRLVLDNTVLVDYYRYRTYETIVPMINAIYNNGL